MEETPDQDLEEGAEIKAPPPPPPPPLESEAEKWATAMPQQSYRLSRTEKIWFYRPYQGGESFSQIDWRQSGRGDNLLVREHEPIRKRPLYLWADNESHNREYVILLLALARLLVADDRQAAWLNAAPALSNQITKIEEQCLDSQTEKQNIFLQEGRLPKNGACFILAAPFAENEDAWASRLKLFAAQGGQGVLIDTSETPLSRETMLRQRAQNLDWPYFFVQGKDEIERLLPDLQAETLRLTL